MHGPSDPPKHEITRLLTHLGQGGAPTRETTDRLFSLVYGELRAIAEGYMARERPDHTLQPTALVHEAFLRLVDQEHVDWRNRAHFFGICARSMRQILINHARSKAAVRRGGPWTRVTLDEGVALGSRTDLDVLELDEALTRFAALDGRAAQVVELRVFGGMSVEESAHVLGVSKRTVDNDWSVARLWLSRELSTDGAP